MQGGVLTNNCFINEQVPINTDGTSTDSPANLNRGVTQNSKLTHYPKLTYEDIFYRTLKPRLGGGGKREENNLRLPNKNWTMVQQRTQRENTRQKYTDSHTEVGWGDGAENSNGKRYGFPGNFKMGRSQWCTGLKRDAIKKLFSSSPNTTGDINIVQYLGIASDEPERIARHESKKNIVLPLVLAGWNEAYCRQWCEENDLLSPIYTTATRGGCWFCHNQGVAQLRLLRKNYPDLWALLMKWDLDSPTTFKADGRTVHDYDKRFELEDKGIISENEPFKWKYIDNPPPRQRTIFELE